MVYRIINEVTKCKKQTNIKVYSISYIRYIIYLFIYVGSVYVIGKGKSSGKLESLNLRSLGNECHQAEIQTFEKGIDSCWLGLVFLSLEEGPFD